MSAPGLALLSAGFILLGMLAIAVSCAASSLSRNYTVASGIAVLVMAMLLYPGLLAEACGLAPCGAVSSIVSIVAQLEDGLFPVGPFAITASAASGLILLSYCVYANGRHDRSRVYIKASVIAVFIGVLLAAAGMTGILDKTYSVRNKGPVPGVTTLYEKGTKIFGSFQPRVHLNEGTGEHKTAPAAPVITKNNRRDILVLYWVVVPLILLLIAVARGIGASGIPEGRKKTIILVMTWLVLMISLALTQDYYFKNRTWKVFPSVREILPHWGGSVESLIWPEPAPAKKPSLSGRSHAGPIDPNCLYAGKDYEHLKRFSRKLSDLQAGRRDVVRIVHYGDSLIWGDCYSKTLKRSFQKEFGDGGRGIVPAVETMATVLQDHVNRTSPSGFTQHAIRHEFRYGGRFFMRPAVNPMVGFTGEGAFIKGPRSEVRLEAPAGSGRIIRVTIYLRAPVNGAPVNEYHVNLDYGTGKTMRVVSLKPGRTGAVVFEIPPSDHISFNFEGSAGANCSVDAVNLETGRGIAYSTIVRMGIHMGWMNAIPDPNLAPLRDVNPDLVIYQFGINEAASLGAFREFTKEELRSQMREWLGKIKRLLPETDVLLIGPPERLQTFQGFPVPMKETFDVQEVQREEAERAGFAYFDTYQCLGGEGQMMKMVTSGLAMSDYTHFTMRGGDRAAEGFYTALMNVHRKKSDRPKLDVSGKESRAIRFNSASYAWFLAFVILAGLALRKKPEIRLIFLAAASYFFYATWQVWPIACLAATTVMDYSMARCINNARERGEKGTGYLVMSLTFGLGLLFALKYFDFFSDLAGKAIHALGYQATVPFMNLLLPVGISFYTFQSLSYTIDVWRGRIKPEKSIIRYAQYVSMFTQLLAGPIVKAREYLPALKERASHFIADHSHFTAALFLILTGLAKKTGADWLAGSIVDRVYESPQMFLPLETLAAVYAYGIQIYGDFSGYTDMAIGSAMLLGFNLTQNFHRPYASLSMTEFWQRWHMSLGKWLGDYLYISLGGNRKRVLFNIGVTMLLCGLWHGAGIPFMLWGLYHGLFLIIERIFGLNKKETKNRFLRGFRIFVTLHIVLFGWIIFRCGTWETFTGVLGSLAGGKWGAPNVGPLLLVVMTVFYALHYTPVAWKERLERAWAGLPASLQGLAASFITIVLYNAATAGIRPFIYFQF
ncbi:MAG TPA: MBOAT family O-acyltransferase [Spirochaetota bacterium]|nr:MBOAT family O-acyltransferase [Spirochaetota bacterium]